MTIHEKLDRLTQLMNRCKVSRVAGFKPQYLHVILKRHQVVTTSAAVAFARVLSVDLAWLVDDARDWPPVHTAACEAA